MTVLSTSVNEEMMSHVAEHSTIEVKSTVPVSGSARSLVSSRLISSLIAGFVLLIAAPNAQALYLDLDHAAATTGRHVMADLGIVVHTEKISEDYKIGIFGGGAGAVERMVHRIEFTGGPVMLHSVDSNQMGTKAALSRPDGERVFHRAVAAIASTVVHRIEMKSWEFAGVSSRASRKLGIRFDILPSPTHPIPEPGAGLLFAAGLTAVAATRRR